MTWAVHISCDGRSGTGSAISPRLVLTSDHVVKQHHRVAVQQVDGKRLTFEVVDRDPELDVALLAPTEPGSEIASTTVLVPRCVWRGVQPSQAVVELCTDEHDTPRSVVVDLSRAAPDARRVHFRVPEHRQGIQPGSSGGPVVEHGQATPRLIGIVRARDNTSLDAFDRAGAGWFVPIDRIASRFDSVAGLVESPIERGSDWDLHWQPRSRGVATIDDKGFFFEGRRNAYERMCEHLAGETGLAVVTGGRGHGKSAVLARAVALSCGRYLTLLGDRADAAIAGYRCPTPPVRAAVLARDKAPRAVAMELARQLGHTSTTTQELLSAERARPSGPIVVDGVDQSREPIALIRELLVPLARSNPVVIAAMARHVHLDVPSNCEWIDLDTTYSDEPIAKYVTRRLHAEGGYSLFAAATVAAEVAKRADRNFLVAELAARTLADREPIDVSQRDWREKLPRDEAEAFGDYLRQFGAERTRVIALLHPLAHARGGGLTLEPPDAWLGIANALRPDEQSPFTVEELRSACASNIGDYLIGSGERSAPRRLYHDGLAVAIRTLSARERLLTRDIAAVERRMREDARVVLRALEALLPPDRGDPVEAFAALDPYLLSHFPTHLADDGQADVLLDWPGLLLTADQESVRGALVRNAVGGHRENEAARVAVVHALAVDRGDAIQRAAALCAALRRQGEKRRVLAIRQALSGRSSEAARLAGRSSRVQRLPYELVSAPPLPPVLATIPNAHDGPVRALRMTSHDGAPLVLSAGDDGSLRSWRLDGRAGSLTRVDAHRTPIKALGVAEHGGQPLVLSGSDDGTLGSWCLDGQPGPLTRPSAHRSQIRALAVADHGGRPLVLSGSNDGTLRSWRLDGQAGPLVLEDAHRGAILALIVVEHDGAQVVVTAGLDGAIRSWGLDGRPGPLMNDHAHSGLILAMSAAEYEGRPLVLTAGDDRVLRSWHLSGRDGPLVRPNAHAAPILALDVVVHDGEPLVLSGGADGALRSWRLDGRRGPLTYEHAHTDWIISLLVGESDDTPFVLTGGDDGTLRIWQVVHPDPAAHAHAHAHDGPLRALAVVEHEEAPLVISAGIGGAVLSWRLDGEPGPLAHEHAHADWIAALMVLERSGGPLVLSAGASGAIRSWWPDGRAGPFALNDPEVGWIIALAVVEHGGGPVVIGGGGGLWLCSWALDEGRGMRRFARAGPIRALQVVEHGHDKLVVSAGADGALRSWRPDGGEGPFALRDAHDGPIAALAVIRSDRAPLVLSGGADGALRSWYLDGRAGPLQRPEAHRGPLMALATTEHHGSPLVLSAGADGALRSWLLDGKAGPLACEHPHDGPIRAVAVVDHCDERLVLTGGQDRAILAYALLIENGAE